VSQRVADLVINNEEFTTRIAKVTLSKMIQRDVSLLIMYQIIAEVLFQTEIRKAGKMEHAAGGGKREREMVFYSTRIGRNFLQ